MLFRQSPGLFLLYKRFVMSQKIASVTIQVPYKSAGGVIHQRSVVFDLRRDGGSYVLVPCLEEEERRVANLPEELRFVMQDGKPVSLRGKMDGNFHIIQDAVTQLEGQNQLV